MKPQHTLSCVLMQLVSHAERANAQNAAPLPTEQTVVDPAIYAQAYAYPPQAYYDPNAYAAYYAAEQYTQAQAYGGQYYEYPDGMCSH